MLKYVIKLCIFEKLWIVYGIEELFIGVKEDYLFECKYSVKERKFYKWNYCFIMLGYDYKEV